MILVCDEDDTIFPIKQYNNNKEESYRLEISNEKRNTFPYIFLRNSPITLIL